mmetsp:Transcript_38221/g.110282  ORF Transcript_38221/g.110282 Transcript_38221/m.110282 type:complete len:585 (-) Transcript_38221:60-1814(-)
MTYTNIQSALICERTADDVPESQKNCAAAGVQLFQVFSSTSALLGLSRCCDYAVVNANLNALINWRRTEAMTGQSNMWGEIRGTGLAGGGTGAAGSHGGGGHGGENMQLQPREVALREEEKARQANGDFPPAYYQRDPARDDLVTAHRESGTPTEVAFKATFSSSVAEGFTAVRGLQVSLKTRDKDDKVLLVANIPACSVENHDGICWTLKRGNFYVGPQFLSWTRELGRLDTVLMPWLDEPDKARLDLDYTVHARLKGSVQVSRAQEKRQITAVLIPGGQVTSARSHEPLAVKAGAWQDVPGLQQISVANRNEKILIICTIKYTALWSDEMTRGRFSIFRDGAALDVHSFGMQSVRALQKGLKRTMVMATVDDPEPGPHAYSARAAVTTDDEHQARVCHLDDDDRQLALIRLPADLVFGPSRCSSATFVEEDRWTEIEGLSVTASLSAKDKAMLVFSVNYNPTAMNYESYFTLFRTSSSGSMTNLGQEDQGMWSVASSSSGSSEYPVVMFTDSPGAGEFTYSVHARTRRCDHMNEATAVEVGPDGQIAAVLLPGSSAGARPDAVASTVVEQMAAEMARGGEAE